MLNEHCTSSSCAADGPSNFAAPFEVRCSRKSKGFQMYTVSVTALHAVLHTTFGREKFAALSASEFAHCEINAQISNDIRSYAESFSLSSPAMLQAHSSCQLSFAVQKYQRRSLPFIEGCAAGSITGRVTAEQRRSRFCPQRST